MRCRPSFLRVSRHSLLFALPVTAPVLLACLLVPATLHAESCSSTSSQASFTADGTYSLRILTSDTLLQGHASVGDSAQSISTPSTSAPSTSGQIMLGQINPGPNSPEQTSPRRSQLIQRTHGHDTLGGYCEISLHTPDEIDSIRVYTSSPTVTFSVHTLTASTTPLHFPTLDGFPSALHRLGHRVQPFGGFQFHFLGSQGPWLLFDNHSNALVLSPADHFFISDMEMPQHTLRSSLVSSIRSLPAGFTHTTVLVSGTGIHATLAAWGRAMQSWVRRPPVSDQADPLLRSLSYWTDNGATYYYKFNPQLGYTGTLLAVADKYKSLGVSLGLIQIDSWFYPKGPQKDWRVFNWKNGAGGAYLYQPDKRLFPNGMGAFAQQLHLPLAVHGRWIDRDSPYRSIYKISGNVAIDPRYWEATASWMQAAHVAVYEQDWLGTFAQAAPDLTSPERFHNLMAQSMRQHSITMQYCMPAPADYLQGTRYSNLTTIRTSDDRFEQKKWDSFLYDSQIAYALGIWPWTDVFMSDELPNLILSTLSSGPVGVGDAIEKINSANLLRAARADGVLVKPDHGIRPLDRIYLADALANTSNPYAASPGISHLGAAMLAVAHSNQPAARISYLFAYPRPAQSPTMTSAPFTPADLGYTQAVFVYDWRSGNGQAVAANDSAALAFRDGWGYDVVSPILSSGFALIGDPQMIATAGKQRLTASTDATGALHLRLRFAAAETAHTLLIYSAQPPHLHTVLGHLAASHYDATSHLLRVTLDTPTDGSAEVALSH